MSESIDLKEYINIFRKRGWIVLLTTIIAIAISGILSFFVIEPVYQAQLTFMVNFNRFYYWLISFNQPCPIVHIFFCYLSILIPIKVNHKCKLHKK